MEFIRQLYEQFAGIWKSLNLQQRIFMVLGCATVLIGLFSLSLWQAVPQHSVLFANLQARDAGEVIDKLKSANISYKLADAGGTILVREEDVAETRLILAQDGLPRGGGVGYEIFDRSRLGITSFEQKINLKRASEGELSRTINQLSEVQWSRVQLALPEGRLFTESREDPTASVFLNLIPGRSLDRRQVRAVQHLVASSIEGMKPENVTIVDQYANALTTAGISELSATELSASQFELRSNVERHFQKKIQNMFDRIVGPSKSVVSVSVALDFDKIEKTEERYDPDGAVVRSEERMRESTTSPGTRTGGVAGISANLPTVVPLAGASSVEGPTRNATSSVTNYEISKTIEHIIRSPSSIKSVSVSVVVDGTYKIITDAAGTTTREYVPRSEEDVEKYRRMVVAALGSPATHSAEVINVPMDAGVAELERVAAMRDREQTDMYLMLGKGVVTVLLLLLIFLMLRYIIRRVLSSRLMVLEQEGIGRRIDQVAEDHADAMAEVQDLAEDRPDDMAALIKVWVKEEE